MTILVVDPALTVPAQVEAREFVDRFVAELEQHVPVTLLRSPASVAAAPVGPNDWIVTVNPPADFAGAEVLALFERAATVGAGFMPVAMQEATRSPVGAAAAVQSFDVIDELRRRHLTHAQLGTVASALARTIVARVQPTLCKEHMRLFVSHRRLDGEELAFAFWEQARARAGTAGVFRDLSDVRAGKDNDEAIIRALESSDAVIFLDTPRSGESSWIARELELALARNLPIVWLRFGPANDRAPLLVTPAAAPWRDYPDADVASVSLDPQVVDDAIHAAFDLSRSSVLRVFDSIGRLRVLGRSGVAEVETLDERHLLYEVQVPRRGARYRERPLVHVVQFFGRWPDADDEAALQASIERTGYHAHPRLGPPYDAAVMVGPVPPNRTDAPGLGSASEGEPPHHGPARHLDAADEYLLDLEQRVRGQPASHGRRGVILSGAFPDCAPEYEQHVRDAVYAFTRAIYSRGGTLVFGGHPTFQPMIFQMAREQCGDDAAERTRLYVSRFFVAPAQLAELAAQAQVTATDVVENDRTQNLTAMRRAMIADGTALGLVAIGGREPTPGRSPGVDEEVALARAAGMPVFLVGSAGGRTATLSADHRAQGEAPLNALSADENEGLFLSYDYGVLANMVLTHLGL